MTVRILLFILTCFISAHLPAQSITFEGTWERVQKGSCGISGFEAQIRLDLSYQNSQFSGKSYILNRRTNQYELQADKWIVEHVSGSIYLLKHSMSSTCAGVSEEFTYEHQVVLDFTGSAQELKFSSIEPLCEQDKCQYQSNYRLSGGEDKPVVESETVYVSSGKVIYGPQVEAGQVLTFESSGLVTLGFWVGNSPPDGVDGYTLYNWVQGYRHGQLLMRLGSSGQWRAVPQAWTPDISGQLQFIVNDADADNNSGKYQVDIGFWNQ